MVWATANRLAGCWRARRSESAAFRRFGRFQPSVSGSRRGNDVDPSRLQLLIRQAIARMVREAGLQTSYREPLVAFVDATDEGFDRIRLRLPDHLHPRDLLPKARSVVSFFLPFDRGLVRKNRAEREEVAAEWALAYIETNRLIGAVVEGLIRELAAVGVRARGEPATDNFDRVRLTCSWSHKSVAVAAGLGSFGVHRLVITDSGCAGRFGSVVLDHELPAGGDLTGGACIRLMGRRCGWCAERCPVSALDGEGGLDKGACWDRLQAKADRFARRDGRIYQEQRAEVCGKCAMGPCALTAPARRDPEAWSRAAALGAAVPTRPNRPGSELSGA